MTDKKVRKLTPKMVHPKTPVGPGAKQSFKEECDINHLMKKYENEGRLPEMRKENPVYGDFTNVQSYHDAQNIVIKANQQFKALDANIRKRFANSPAKLLEFVADVNNKAEAIALGIIPEEKPAEPENKTVLEPEKK